MNTEKFKGVFPAFYACYDDNGEISAERTQLLAKPFDGEGRKRAVRGRIFGRMYLPECRRP